MKKSLIFLFILMELGICAIAQVPAGFNYQAVIRNKSGEIIANHQVSFKISILSNPEDGTSTYVETQEATTNEFGLVSLQIGRGNKQSGEFNPSKWGSDSHFMKVELDAEGGNSYSHISTTQLMAVPYAFHAQTVENDKVNDADADATNEIQTMSLSGTELTLSNGGGTVTLPSSGEGGDNWGTQKVISGASLTGDGTASSPLAVQGDLTDDQTLSINGNELTISEGNTITIPGGSESKWLNSNSDIYFNSAKVGIGYVPTDNTISRLYVYTTEIPIAISALNNHDWMPAFVAENFGNGSAAEFRNHIKIVDGTQGEGKILTSDEYGKTSWRTPESGSWSKNDNNIYTNFNKVGIGIIPTDLVSRKLSVLTTNMQAIGAQNNSVYGTIYAENAGDGPAADFRNHIKINDGSQGAGKVLTSDSVGNTSWQTPESSPWTKSGDDLHYTDGNVKISGEVQTESTGNANMVPIAYGTIKSDGTIATSSGNISVTKNGTGIYLIKIDGHNYTYFQYIFNATLISDLGFVRANNTDGKIRVFTADKTGTYKDEYFSFVVYKP